MDERIVHIFNNMHDEYEEKQDLWYSWIFSRLHYFIANEIISKGVCKKNVLDIGCGTGFQSYLFSQAGAKVTGIDISDKLIEVAKSKNEYIFKKKSFQLFEPKFQFVNSYNKRIEKILKSSNAQSINKPKFQLGNATKLNFKDNYFDIINCCGSTFSFIDDYLKAISEIQRCLRTGGTFIIEIESKNNLDLIWTLLDSIVFMKKLGYETSYSEAKEKIFDYKGKHINVEYPFGDMSNPVYMDIRLFQKKTFIKELKSMGLIVKKKYSIHSITNIIPSTLLDSNNPSKFNRSVFNLLRKVEEIIPMNLPACSILLIGEKI